MLYRLPWLLANAWESFLRHHSETSAALAAGRVMDGSLGLPEIETLITPWPTGYCPPRWPTGAWVRRRGGSWKANAKLTCQTLP